MLNRNESYKSYNENSNNTCANSSDFSYAGSFDMTKQMYRIYLEDYSLPRSISAVKPYYGTMNDIINLMVELSDNPGTNMRYKESIEAVEYYDLNNDVTHVMAGQVLRVLMPVQEVRRFETQLEDLSWRYTSTEGIEYPCWASRADICRVLLKTDTGYDLCLKAKLEGVTTCLQNIGWINLNGIIKGFPGTVHWDGTYYTMNLFVLQKHFNFDEIEMATADMVNMNHIDLSVIMEDIIAEG